jgi:hypothetical protein
MSNDKVIINGVMCEPFDLEKLKAGAQAISRKGLKLVDFHVFNTGSNQPLFGPLEGDLTPRRWTEDGRYFDDSEYDLFIMPKTNVMYCTVYKEGDVFITGNTLYETPEEVKKEAVDGSFVGTVTFSI